VSIARVSASVYLRAVRKNLIMTDEVDWFGATNAELWPMPSPERGPLAQYAHPDRATELPTQAIAQDIDLSTNQPGEAARRRAQQEYAARQRDSGRLRAWVGKTLDVHTDERAWRIGANAEESVGAELDKLREHGWRVLHSIPVGAFGSCPSRPESTTTPSPTCETHHSRPRGRPGSCQHERGSTLQ
jgi:hypothetical protein